ncbi:MAG TPA: hypothetical protein DDZ51_14545 [Planctomycetaceae bacterium]|nr:hypothetical protein [Planctomycetaceae bacterium]
MQTASRFLVIAAISLPALLTCSVTLGQEPADNPDAKTPSIAFLKPLVNVELSFAKIACELTDDQMKPIVAEAKKAHQAMADIVIRQDAAGDDFFTKNNVIFTGPNDQLMVVNPFKRIRDDVAKLLKPLVTEDQYTKFTEESRLREEYEREAAVHFLLNLLDLKLVLSTEQRKRLHEKLMAQWQDLDLHILDSSIMDQNDFPPAPDHLIIPELNDSQQKLLVAQTRDSTHVYIGEDELLNSVEGWLDQ